MERQEKNHQQKGNYKSYAAAVTGIAAIVCVVVTAVLVCDYIRLSRASEEKLEELRGKREEYTGSIAPKENGTASETAREPESLPQGTAEKSESPYAELFESNPDMAAWLQVEGTKIDYPVMQRPGDDEYYLYRDFDGGSDKAGCLILDKGSSLEEPETTNLMIHGHNMKSGAMFGGLDLYQKEDYYQEHKYIKLFTPQQERHYEVIAAFYSQVYLTTDLVFKYYNFFQADTEEEFHYFYDNIKKLSLYDTGLEAEFGDRFLTLSTCSYQVEDGRFVVVAKEIKDGVK